MRSGQIGGGAAAVTVTGEPPTEDDPAEVTIDGGDGTVVRCPWGGRVPQVGDAGAVIQDDDGTYWLVGTWPR